MTQSLQNLEVPMKLLRLTQHPRLANFEARARDAGAAGLPAAPASPDSPDVYAARTWAAALRTSITTARAEVPRLRKRIVLISTVQLVADIGSATSVTALLAMIYGTEAAHGYKVAVALLAVVTSLASAVTSYLNRAQPGGSGAEQLATLLDRAGKAEGLALDLEIWVDSGPGRPPLDPNLLATAHALVTELTSREEARPTSPERGSQIGHSPMA